MDDEQTDPDADGARRDRVQELLRPAVLREESIPGSHAYLVEALHVEVSAAMGSTAVADVVEPALHVLMPAVHGVALRHEDERIRSMYVNLLARACSLPRASRVHPAFVSIIDRLAPLDAEAIPHLGGWILDIDVVDNERGGSWPVARNVSFAYQTILSTPSFRELEEATDNLIALGLVQTGGRRSSDSGEERWIKSIPDIRKLIAGTTYDDVAYYYLLWSEGRIWRTTFGDRFWDVTSSPLR